MYDYTLARNQRTNDGSSVGWVGDVSKGQPRVEAGKSRWVVGDGFILFGESRSGPAPLSQSLVVQVDSDVMSIYRVVVDARFWVPQIERGSVINRPN